MLFAETHFRTVSGQDRDELAAARRARHRCGYVGGAGLCFPAHDRLAIEPTLSRAARLCEKADGETALKRISGSAIERVGE